MGQKDGTAPEPKVYDLMFYHEPCHLKEQEKRRKDLVVVDNAGIKKGWNSNGQVVSMGGTGPEIRDVRTEKLGGDRNKEVGKKVMVKEIIIMLSVLEKIAGIAGTNYLRGCKPIAGKLDACRQVSVELVVRKLHEISKEKAREGERVRVEAERMKEANLMLRAEMEEEGEETDGVKPGPSIRYLDADEDHVGPGLKKRRVAIAEVNAIAEVKPMSKKRTKEDDEEPISSRTR